MSINGYIVGYDPGGNGKNGFAALQVLNNQVIDINIQTLLNAESVINEIKNHGSVIGLGVETLSCWCTGNSGWRPADKWLRSKYTTILNSITSPNSLSGSMSINGMAVLIEVKEYFKNIIFSESHPKVLYHALSKDKYNYIDKHKHMDLFLSDLFNINIVTRNDHEWDAVISAYALLQGITGNWKMDLHKLPLENNSRLVTPCGKTAYFWPYEND